jgi:hypothetical protein
MEYRQDLNGHFKKSKFQFFIGILFFLFTIFLIHHRISSGQGFRIWDWIGIVIFLLNGLYHLTGGMGYLLENFLGRKSFVHIDEEKFRIRTVGKEHRVFWSDIESIEFKNGYLEISRENNSTRLITLSSIDSTLSQSIVARIKEFATKKNIRFLG